MNKDVFLEKSEIESTASLVFKKLIDLHDVIAQVHRNVEFK